MSAILTGLPLRAQTICQLKCQGADRHVFFPRGASADQVLFDIPGELIKTGEPIKQSLSPRGQMSPRKILRWFLDEPRHLLLAGHTRRPARDLLFCGLGYSRLHRAWDRGTQYIGLPMTQHLVRHAIATMLFNEDSNYAPAIAALLGNSEQTVRRYYAFVDEERQRAKGLAGLQTVAARLRGNVADDKLPRGRRTPSPISEVSHPPRPDNTFR